MHAPPRRPVRLVFAALLAVAGTSALGFWMAGPNLRREKRLPDGTRLTFEGFTYTNPHRLLLGNPLQKLLLPFAGPPLGPRTVRRDVPDEESPVFWLRTRGRGDWTGSGVTSAFDDTGWEGPLFGKHGHYPVRAGMEQPVHSFRVPFFPRGAHRWGLRHYDTSGNTSRVDWEFVLPGPPVPVPVLPNTAAVDVLPFTVRHRDLDCTLLAMQTPSGRMRHEDAVQIAFRRDVDAMVRITRGGKPAPDWEVVDMTVSTPEGYPLAADGARVRRSRGFSHAFEVYAQGSLRPEVRFCKFSVVLARSPLARFSGTETVRFRGVPVPAAGTGVSCGEIGQVGNTAISLFYALNSRSSLRVLARLDTSDHRLRPTLVQAVDEHGRRLPPSTEPMQFVRSEYAPPMVWGIDLPAVPATTQALDLTVALQQTETVDFLIDLAHLPAAKPAAAANTGGGRK